jgi:hypothetical protein
MKPAAEWRAEAARMREYVRVVANPEAPTEINAMIEECERRARGLGDGASRNGCANTGPSWH